VNCATTDEPIEVPFGVWTVQWGPRCYVLEGARMIPTRRVAFVGEIVSQIFRTDSTGSPDCLPILLSISVFTF